MIAIAKTLEGVALIIIIISGIYIFFSGLDGIRKHKGFYIVPILLIVIAFSIFFIYLKDSRRNYIEKIKLEESLRVPKFKNQ